MLKSFLVLTLHKGKIPIKKYISIMNKQAIPFSKVHQSGCEISLGIPTTAIQITPSLPHTCTF